MKWELKTRIRNGNLNPVPLRKKTLCISEGYCVSSQDSENGYCMLMNLAEFRIML